MKKISAFIERGSDGLYSVYIDLNDTTLNYGVHGSGETVEDAISDFNSAYEAMKEFHTKKEKEFVEAEFNFKYDLASFLQYYSNKLSLAGLARITGVNQGQLSHYMTGHRKPSKRTVEKIEKSLHEFAKEISQVSFV